MDDSTYPVQQRQPLSMSGLRPTASPPKAVRPPAPNPELPVRRAYFKPKPKTRREHRFLQKLQMSLLILAGIAGGFFADSVALGLGLLAIYSIFAFATRIPSRTTFTLALLLLTAICLLLLLKPNLQLIRNFATYAFVLLLIGTITLGREARLPRRMPRKYRR